MRTLRFSLAAFVATSALLALDGAARAQTDEPPSTPPATAPSQDPAASQALAQWHHDYSAARDRLLAGDFAVAADAFEVLSHDPRAPADERVLAQTMRDLARSWADRDLALVKRGDLGESNLSARAVNERTTDEIAQLYAASIFYGIGSGLWVDAHTQAASTGGLILPLILFSGAAAGGVALLDVGHPLHYGVAQSAVSGLYLGFEEGLVLSLWSLSLPNNNWQGSAVADVIWSFSTVGAIGGGVLGTALGATPGRAAFVGSTGLWAGVITGLAAAAFTSGQNSGSSALFAANVGLSAGVVAGLLAAGPVSPSIARVRFLDIGAVGGGLLVGGLYLAAANNTGNAQAALGTTALGVTAGLAVAWAATARMPVDRPEDRAKAAALLMPTLAPLPGGRGATVGVMGTL
jgi:hypothetical protein